MRKNDFYIMKTRLQKIFIELLWIFTGLCLVFGITCLKYDLIDSWSWHVPALYQDDAIPMLALFKAASVGEYIPYKSIIFENLGAPFSGNWNDYPFTGPVLIVFAGFLSNLFGLGFASNAVLLIAHLVSALSMYVCLRLAGSVRIWALVFSICFGLCPFLFARGFTHIVLTFAYSVPIALLIGLMIYRKGSAFLSGWRLFFVLVLSFYLGGIFTYYTAFYLIVMAFAGLYCFCNERKVSCLLPFILIAVLTFTNFFLLTEPLREYAREHGPNEFGVSRFYSNLQVCALRPIELFLPGSGSQIPVLKQLSAFYENQDIFQNRFEASESMAAYMGIPAIFGFCVLMCMTGYFIFTRRQQMISGWFWVVGFFMAFAVVGGLNGFLGLGKFFLLRSSNRVSIYIVAACLFFFAILLTRWKKNIPQPLLICFALILVGFAVFEALPTGESMRPSTEKRLNSDREMVAKLDADLPQGAMIFNYPVIDFPESGTYSFLRPYLFSEDLRFSSGSVKGRARESWQHEIEKLPPNQMIDSLQKIGFSGILVYKGRSVPEKMRERSLLFLEAIRAMPNSKLESSDGDFVFIRLVPDEFPQLPKIKPQFLSAWWPAENRPSFADAVNLPIGSKWCAQKFGEVEIFNEMDKPQAMNTTGIMFSPQDSIIQISIGKESLKTLVLKANIPEVVNIQLPALKPGASRLIFKSNRNPIICNGRKFNFALAFNEP